MKVLVINCGSSSLKYQLFNMEDSSVMAKGLCERIGIDGMIKHTPTGKPEYKAEAKMANHRDALKLVIKLLLSDEYGVIGSLDEISAIGHRVVHVGEAYSESHLITKEVYDAAVKCTDLAPLHNPANLMGIDACNEVMGDVKQVAVFDTAFHQTMPKEAYICPIPYKYYDEYKVRNYGFHGISHNYVSIEAAKLLGKDANNFKLITCHLGNGSSITAVKNGKSVDTSMGFTPLAGILMGTRSGSIDPGVITYIMNKEKLDVKGIDDILNKKSGALGISGVSSDFRDIDEAAQKGNEQAKLAIDMFCYQVKKYIGSYAAAMGGVDAIVFTAGIGENSSDFREKILEGLEFLGVAIDKQANKQRGKAMDISLPEAKTRVLVIPTNEELMIANETKRVIDSL